MNQRLTLLPGIVRFAKAQSAAVAAGVVLLLAIGSPQALGQRIFYRLTSIADTQQQFPFANLSQFPCQNNENRVAFQGTLVGGVEAMFSTRTPGNFDDLADTGTGDYFTIISDCSVNALDMVLFSAQKQLPDHIQTLLLRGGGGNFLLPLLDSDGPYDSFFSTQLNIQGKAANLREPGGRQRASDPDQRGRAADRPGKDHRGHLTEFAIRRFCRESIH